MTNAVSSSTVSTGSQAGLFDGLAQHAHWAPRIALASVFLYHGLTKFPNLSGMAEMMGMPVFLLTLVALAEVGGGALVIIGAFTKDIVTRIGGLLLIPPMLGAIFMVHWGRWSFAPADGYPMGGMEFQVTLLLLAAYFVLRGNKA
ncbi:MAG: DoxX family protein [Chloroflexi bacterium]|nr:DoxX family protein [Chloroflexota bacterium]